MSDLTETHTAASGARKFPSQPRLFAVELKGSGEVQLVARVKGKESGDQMRVAPDDAELAAELLFSIGHATPAPSPLPVREAAV